MKDQEINIHVSEGTKELVKDRDEFGKHGRSPDGRRSNCKACMKKRELEKKSDGIV